VPRERETERSKEREALLSVARGAARAGPHVAWPELLDLAEQQGLLPLLAASPLVSAMPASLQRETATRAVMLKARSQAAVRELGRIAAAFRAVDLRLLCWKGPVQSLQLYGASSLRSFSDIDLVVDPHDALRAEELLEALGYVPHVALTKAQLRAFRRVQVERVLVHAGLGQVVDFHWGFAGVPFPFPLPFDDAWARHVEVVVDGETLPTLGPVDALVAAATHAARHLWCRLEQVAALDRLARQRLDWDGVDALAAHLGVRRQVGASLLLAQGLLDTPTPALPGALTAARPLFPGLLSEVEENMFAGAARRCDAGPRDLWRLGDRRRDAVRALAHAVFVPTTTDWSASPALAGAGWLAWLARPPRLALKYARRWLRRADA
jgi:hypothetical protein